MKIYRVQICLIVLWSANLSLIFCQSPYVFHKSNKNIVLNTVTANKDQQIVEHSIHTLSGEDLFLLSVIPTKEEKETFVFPLKEKLTTESSLYPQIDKVMVISDIEGELGAFQALLRAGGAIDGTNQWSFGNGHLVLVGDFFDRGQQVVETLWLIYALEQQAQEAGGGVHFVMGNHEIMNLSGDYRYVHPKYFKEAKAMGKDYFQLFDESSELGRWLRTKNVMVKIGDNLFVHGGIPAEVNRLEASIEEINELARPYYEHARALPFSNELVNTIFNYSTSPFWYRGYFHKTPDNMEAVIDSTLQKFGVKHIITGHTVVGDEVSTHYNNKVINVDTPHAEGKSGALLIEKGKYYRIDAEGKKELLW